MTTKSDEEIVRNAIHDLAAFEAHDGIAFRLAQPAMAALDRLVERQKAAEWQPIETAPRDGTRFLAITKGGMMRVDRLNVKKQDSNERFWEESGTPDGRYTHWMPLPEKPE